MQTHHLQRKNKNQSEKRVGRGGKKGTYSGKGMKGQKARAGRKLQPLIKMFLKKYHKARGYKFNVVRNKPTAVKLSVLLKHFEAGDQITPEDLVAKKIIGANESAKIVGGSSVKKIDKAFTIKNIPTTKKVAQLIEGSGGKIE